MTTGPLLVDTADGVVTLTLHRPEARNAMNAAMREALIDALRSADADHGVAVVIITGADPVFSAGADLKESLANGLPPRPRTNVGQAIRGASVPVICAVNGACVTGALEVALSASFIVASEHARFADTHARVGLLPGWGMSALLPAAVGVRMARQMTASGNFVDAAEALRIGLVNEVVPHDHLLPRARGIAADIASADRAAVRASLALYGRGAGATLAHALGLEAEAVANWDLDPASARDRFATTIQRGSARS
jgi:enoyl-CoA hydratase